MPTAFDTADTAPDPNRADDSAKPWPSPAPLGPRPAPAAPAPAFDNGAPPVPGWLPAGVGDECAAFAGLAPPEAPDDDAGEDEPGDDDAGFMIEPIPDDAGLLPLLAGDPVPPCGADVAGGAVCP